MKILLLALLIPIPLMAKAKRDLKLEEYIKYDCAGQPKDCPKGVRDCYLEIEKSIAICNAKYKGVNRKEMFADPCSEKLIDYGSLTKREKVHQCREYVLDINGK